MNIDHLRYFLVLSQEMHYSRAAQRLNISQSGLSHAIVTLEKELGVSLFQKSGRGIALGRFGEALLPQAQPDRGLAGQLPAQLPDAQGRGGDHPAADHPPAGDPHRHPAVPAVYGGEPRV